MKTKTTPKVKFKMVSAIAKDSDLKFLKLMQKNITEVTQTNTRGVALLIAYS